MKDTIILNDPRRHMITALGASHPHPSISDEAHTFDRFVGTWDCDYTNFRDDGTIERSRDEVIFGWILDGRAVQDIWAWADPNDATQERKMGTTIRFFDPQDLEMAHYLDLAGGWNHQEPGWRRGGRSHRPGRHGR
jgi:hypothetical protein